MTARPSVSRRTEWHEVGADWSLPLGQRVLVTDADEIALMDVRDLAMTRASGGAE